MFDRNITHFASGEKRTFGSRRYWCFDMFTSFSERNTPGRMSALSSTPWFGISSGRNR